MSNAPEEPRRRIGLRRRKEEEAEAEETLNTQTALPQQGIPPNAESTAETRSTRRKAPKAMEASAPASVGLHMDPIAPNMTDRPTAPTVTACPAAATTHSLHSTTHPHSMGGAAEDIFALDYDRFAAEDLYALLRRLTRQEVERRMVEHEQLRRKQQQAPQVERFLDYTAPSNTGSSHPNHSNGNMASGEVGVEELGGYRYSDMLQRLFVALNRNKESSAMSERNQLPVPQLEKIGKKKVIITNFGRICQAFHRPIEDVKDYIEKELSVGGNLDSNNALILKYEIQKATAFDKILIKYLDEFVKCNSCHKIDTTLTKEGRRMELRCNWCTATRSVQAVGSATYSAQVGKRSKARLQALTL